MYKVSIQTDRCIDIAEHIKANGDVPHDVEDPMPYAYPNAVVHNAWCAIVGINQQTTPVVGQALRGTVEGILYRGWDYLLRKSISAANRDAEIFTARWLRTVTAAKLKNLFYDDEYGNTLNQIRQRTNLLRDIGTFIHRKGWESINELYSVADGYIVRSDGNGIAQLLAGMRAYRDPVQKKLFYFLALMQNQGLWKYRDPINVGPPVNYHEQRGHLRLGTVRIESAELLYKIRGREEISPEEDIEIRMAVRRAIEFIAQYLSVTPSAMHYYFWNHIRNCCSRDNPHCKACVRCTLPSRYRVRTSGCIFAAVCPSAGLPNAQMLIEPRIDNTIWQ